MDIIFLHKKDRAYLSIFLIIALLVLSMKISAYPLRFNNLHNIEGLSSRTVNCIYQDQKGFLWFGTINGLNKFDGHHFTHYNQTSLDSHNISGNNITYIIEDQKGYLWIGTENSGLNRFDPAKEQFLSFQHDPANDSSIHRNRTWSIAEDSAGTIWAVTDIALNKKSKSGKTFSRHIYYHEEERWMPKIIKTDKDGSLWVTCWRHGLFHINANDGSVIEIINLENGNNQTNDFIIRDSMIIAGTYGSGLFIVNKSTGEIHKWLNTKNNSALASNRINALTIDQQNNLWVATDEGVSIHSLKNLFPKQHIRKNKKQSNHLSYPMNHRISDVFEDASGVIWFGLKGGGLKKYSPQKNQIQAFEANNQQPQSLQTNEVTNLLQDKKGNIWVATWGKGLSQFLPEEGKFINRPLSFKDKKNNKRIHKLFLDKEDNIWIGTRNNGLYRMNKNHSTEHIFGGNITSIDQDKKGNLWLGNWGKGLIKIKKEHLYSSSPERIFIDSVFATHVFDFFIDSKNRIWAATWYTGINCFDPEDNTITKYKYNPQDQKDDYSTSHQISFLEDANGTIWAGSPENGLLKIKSPSKTEHAPYPTYCLQEANKGHFFAGTKNGLIKINIDHSNIKADTIALLSGYEIYNIEKDKNSLLWLFTDQGMIRYNPVGKERVLFTIANGLLSNSFFNGEFLQLDNGPMLLSGQHGLNYFHPTEIRKSRYSPALRLSELYINDQRIIPGKQIENKIILKKTLPYTSKIQLPYGNNVVKLFFSAMDFHAPENIQYVYQLIGYDQRKRHTNDNYATYTYLPAGKYIFKVASTNSDRIWTGKSTTLHIEVLPPIWNTLWFRILLSVIIISITVLLYLNRVKRIKKRNKKLNQLVEARTRDLVQLNATKDRLFSIIGHDLKNPVNAISGFGNLLLDNYDNYDEDRRYSFIRQITHSSENIKTLLDNLMHWSKFHSERIEFKPEHINLKTLIEESISYLKLSASSKSIQIKYEGYDHWIYADPYMMQVVLQNLITNSIKFSEENGKIIIWHKKEINYDYIFVKDYGQGMEAETKDQLFKYNEQLSTTGTKGEKGTGLGLLLCKDFIQHHNGKITVTSAPGQGASIKIILPKKT